MSVTVGSAALELPEALAAPLALVAWAGPPAGPPPALLAASFAQAVRAKAAARAPAARPAREKLMDMGLLLFR
jgi:hypothetical protein